MKDGGENFQRPRLKNDETIPVAFVRDGRTGQTKTIESANTHFVTATQDPKIIKEKERNEQKREYRIVPCGFLQDFTQKEKSVFAQGIIAPEAISTLLARGVFITTEPGTAQQSTDSALLMHYHTSTPHKKTGRGGILLRREKEKWAPIIVTLSTPNGPKEFVLDVKGTGTPDGRLEIDSDGKCIGGMDEVERIPGNSPKAEQEYIALSEAAKQHPRFRDGIVPLPISWGIDARGFGQVIRAIPTTLRPSFVENKTLEGLNELNHEQIAYGLAVELGRYLGFKTPLLCQNLTTENAYLVNNDQGSQEIIATDFMEIQPIHRSTSPVNDLYVSISILYNSTFENEKGLAVIVSGFISGLREVRPDVQINEADFLSARTPEEIAQIIFEQYLALEVYLERKKEKIKIDFDYLKKALSGMHRELLKRFEAFETLVQIESYLQQEEKLYTALDVYCKGESETVKRKLHYIRLVIYIIQRDTRNLEIGLEDLEKYKRMLPIPE
jgi:hypothetical protein